MASSSIVIRIHVGEDRAMDWTAQPDSVTFKATLELICQVLPGCVILAFEYEDEDGDRITVRSEEEMRNMISFYMEMLNEKAGPLIIYPRVSKPPDKRNIHGLKVLTNNSSDMGEAEPEKQDSGSKKQERVDIREILARGKIHDFDLQYLSELGAGAAGTVYKARHLPSNTIMAVKVTPLDITPEVQKQILSELEILNRCDMSAIIGFYGAFFMDNRISMCTEYMDGGSLDKYGQIAEAVLCRIAAVVVKGLHYLWSLRIMHRDVKPSNILVNTLGCIKLCDFGVSVQLVNSIAKTFIGTNVYMAPERINGQDYSIHSDVWSLGVSLFEMALGKSSYPVNEARPMELINMIVNQQTPPQLPQGVFSDAFVNLVSHCMQKDPRQRPTPAQLLQHPCTCQWQAEDSHIVAEWVCSQLQKHKS